MTLQIIKILLISTVLATYLISDVEACPPECPNYQSTYMINVNRRRIITHLNDSLKLRDLALIGTRYSASHVTSTPRYRTQELTMSQQLNYGVRVLDSAIWSSSNEFYLYKWAKYLMTFDEFLKPIDSFLTANPRELVIILMHEEYKPAKDVTRSNCEILKFYQSLNDGRRIVINWSLDDTIKQHRGKILLAGLDSSFQNCGFDVTNNCKVQNKNPPSDTMSDIEDKWIAVIKFHGQIYHQDNGHCFINFLADTSDTNSRPMAVEGYSTLRHGCEAPINVRLVNFFSNPHRGLIIVMADFPTQNLIDSILSTNFKGNTFYTKYIDDSE